MTWCKVGLAAGAVLWAATDNGSRKPHGDIIPLLGPIACAVSDLLT
jgi:hypothetical protein